MNCAIKERHLPGVLSAVLMLLSIWGWAQTTPTLTRGPYLQIGTSTSIVVRWRTDLATASRVNYGTDPANLTQQVDSTALTTEHEVTLTGLFPATRYYYAIGDGATILAGGVDYFFITAPVVGTRKKTRFWILGDSGHNNSVQQAVKNAYFAFTDTVHTDFWVMLGDNAYSSGTDAQGQPVASGLYIYRMVTENFVHSRRMLLVR